MSSVKKGFKSIDKGWNKVKKIVKNIKDSKNFAKVGILDGSKNHREDGDGLTNAELGTIHEYGSPEHNIPERSFLRSTMQANMRNYVDLMNKSIGPILEGKLETNKMLNLVGAKAAGDVKHTIQSSGVGPFFIPADAPETIARKGSSRPLIDTGQLVTSITWAVEKVGEEPEEE